MAEAGGVLDRGCEIDDAHRRAAPRLARRLADQIDEFRLIGHGGFPRERRSQGVSVRSGP